MEGHDCQRYKAWQRMMMMNTIQWYEKLCLNETEMMETSGITKP